MPSILAILLDAGLASKVADDAEGAEGRMLMRFFTK